MIRKISIIGGDLRIAKLADMLVEEGVEVFTYGLEEYESAEFIKCSSIEEAANASDVILGPIPFSSNGENINTPFGKEKINIIHLFDTIKNKTLIAGAIKQPLFNSAADKDIEIIDILKREELSVLNAISTAEGAIKIAIEETQKTIHGSNILVMGFGRIGKILAKMLYGIGANVSCEARKNSDLAWIKAYGYNPIPLKDLNENLYKFDIIINTIPYVIIDKSNIENIRKDCLLIDLASNPGGVDKEIVKEKNIRYILALSLPGKIAPVTSAEFIKETLYNIFNEIKEN